MFLTMRYSCNLLRTCMLRAYVCVFCYSITWRYLCERNELQTLTNTCSYHISVSRRSVLIDAITTDNRSKWLDNNTHNNATSFLFPNSRAYPPPPKISNFALPDSRFHNFCGITRSFEKQSPVTTNGLVQEYFKFITEKVNLWVTTVLQMYWENIPVKNGSR